MLELFVCCEMQYQLEEVFNSRPYFGDYVGTIEARHNDVAYLNRIVRV